MFSGIFFAAQANINMRSSVGVAVLGWVAVASALRNGLDLVPPMGWSNW
jgi:hypothetical protein